MTEDSINNSGTRLSEKSVVISVVILVVGICLAVGIFFYSRWHGEKVVLVLERWGNFGDFFGGILNPVIGLGGVILLAYTLIQNQKALTETAQIMKSQADLAQYDQRRQSVISILTSSANVAFSPTVNTFEFDGATFAHAHMVDLSGVYAQYILDNNISGCNEFSAYLDKSHEVSLISALFAVKKLVDEEADNTRKQLLLTIVISFIPVQLLLILFTRVRRSMLMPGRETMAINSLTIEIIVDCLKAMGLEYLLSDFEKEAKRTVNNN